MMSKIKAAFCDLEAGWVTLSIEHEGKALEIRASYVYDYFGPLTSALHRLLEEQGQFTITLLGEPDEYEFVFERIDDLITLEIKHFPDHLHNTEKTKHLFFASGSYLEVCVPFWRALRALQGQYSANDLEARWRRAFPCEEMNRLTAAIKDK